MESINQTTDKIDGIRTRVKDMEDIDSLSVICGRPKSLKIEVSASCNLGCQFCFHRNSEHDGLMTMADYIKAIEIAYKYKIPQVGLLFLGEPTMNPDLPKMITIAKKTYKIPYVFITSNGMCSKDMIKDIMNSGLDSLKWSVNYPTKESFARGTGVDGFSTMVENIKYAATFKSSNTKLYASSAVYDVNNIDPELFKFIEKEIKPYVYEHYYFKLNNQGGLIQDDHFQTMHCNRLPVIPCPRLFNNSYITHDLKVALCCSAFTDDFIIGDLKKDSFDNIWNGKKMQNLRKAHLSGDVSNIICGGRR